MISGYVPEGLASLLGECACGKHASLQAASVQVGLEGNSS